MLELSDRLGRQLRSLCSLYILPSGKSSSVASVRYRSSCHHLPYPQHKCTPIQSKSQNCQNDQSSPQTQSLSAGRSEEPRTSNDYNAAKAQTQKGGSEMGYCRESSLLRSSLILRRSLFWTNVMGVVTWNYASKQHVTGAGRVVGHV